jgi:hypothetical protein
MLPKITAGLNKAEIRMTMITARILMASLKIYPENGEKSRGNFKFK